MHATYDVFINLVFVAATVGIVCRGISNEFERITNVETDIRKRANMPVRGLGYYDQRVQVSIKNLTLAIFVHYHKMGISGALFNVATTWALECNKDESKYIYNGVHDAWTVYLSAVNTAEDKDNVDFPVSSAYDYHTLPRSLMYNDFVACDELLKRIDEYVEVRL